MIALKLKSKCAPWPMKQTGWRPQPARLEDIVLAYLRDPRHVVERMAYQPGNRFHLFQFLEFGYLLVLSGLLVAATVALICRRSA